MLTEEWAANDVPRMNFGGHLRCELKGHCLGFYVSRRLPSIVLWAQLLGGVYHLLNLGFREPPDVCQLLHQEMRLTSME